jgi:hypothetical protein
LIALFVILVRLIKPVSWYYLKTRKVVRDRWKFWLEWEAHLLSLRPLKEIEQPWL